MQEAAPSAKGAVGQESGVGWDGIGDAMRNERENANRVTVQLKLGRRKGSNSTGKGLAPVGKERAGQYSQEEELKQYR